ncbi:unnamed protein product [Clonostachys rhizophaga]|uniref:Zn(2)-C6 fungal-type domain-containing protein n=1 Tax=Clonostachys rhizophaga TaxID=160324 RepID=A0A9N9YFP7_9HYPO|nr:unnamed protein product [Clonostachys rhizophaga]
MLSNPLQRYSPYQNLNQSPVGPNGQTQQSSLTHHGLDSLGQATQYNLQLQQHAAMQDPQLARVAPQPKQRQPSFGSSGRGTSGQVRRRISRACDQCNQLRTKCDGQHPCAHCLEFGLGCEYARERKKRGKASRRDLAAQAAARAAAESTNGQRRGSNSGGDGSMESEVQPSVDSVSKHTENQNHELNQHEADNSVDQFEESAMAAASATGVEDSIRVDHHGLENGHVDNAQAIDMNGFANMPHGFERQDIGAQLMESRPYETHQGHPLAGYQELPFPMQDQSPPNFQTNGGFRIGNSPLGGYAIGAGAPSPGWGIPFSSPPAAAFGGSRVHQGSFDSTHQNGPSMRYPVLEPLLPHLGNILPISLACDLIDLYFASSSSAKMHPMSPYVLGFVFRKRAFLHLTRPRRCQPALLASMLWVAAQTSDASFLTSMPSARSKTCQKLLELTVGLLNPLIHVSAGQPSPGTHPGTQGAVSLGGLGVALPGSISMSALTGESGAFGAAGSLDDVITYIHLATVVSASEYKGASLRWWNAAWSLARELKLGRELPPSAMPLHSDQGDLETDGLDEHDLHRNNSNFVTEEEREERRRIWWLVYIVDRHLALCYNRPLFLLDIECEGLLQPLDDSEWQRGDFGSSCNAKIDPNVLNPIPEGSTADLIRPRGPGFDCRGHGIFGYFLPLMTILGEIVDLHHARNHPRFGVGFRSNGEWDEQTAEIARHLEMYEQTLKAFEQHNLPKSCDDKGESGLGHHEDMGGASVEASTPSVKSVHTSSSGRMTESDIQTRIVIAYGTHVMHVLHILLAGKWDPINLIDDEDLWISSQGFITATSHAVSAADAISHILEFDPGLEFMPFFFGIYLLQGSFLLLLIADKLQLDASPSVVRACETIVRAHEACVVTLSTEYQRNFSKVMRSALAQVRGRVPEDLNEQNQRRRELLALYRWTGDGTGLAL